MAMSFDAIVGTHEKALYLRDRRLKVLSNNLANVDTPNYKAQDFDFNKALKEATTRSHSEAQNRTVRMSKTHGKHFSIGLPNVQADLKYRVPFQPALDGNTVELEVEQAKFAENAMRYQATLAFVSRKFSGIKNALNDQ